jgi:hypothetical protein
VEEKFGATDDQIADLERRWLLSHTLHRSRVSLRLKTLWLCGCSLPQIWHSTSTCICNPPASATLPRVLPHEQNESLTGPSVRRFRFAGSSCRSSACSDSNFADSGILFRADGVQSAPAKCRASDQVASRLTDLFTRCGLTCRRTDAGLMLTGPPSSPCTASACGLLKNARQPGES